MPPKKSKFSHCPPNDFHPAIIQGAVVADRADQILKLVNEGYFKEEVEQFGESIERDVSPEYTCWNPLRDTIISPSGTKLLHGVRPFSDVLKLKQTFMEKVKAVVPYRMYDGKRWLFKGGKYTEASPFNEIFHGNVPYVMLTPLPALATNPLGNTDCDFSKAAGTFWVDFSRMVISYFCTARYFSGGQFGIFSLVCKTWKQIVDDIMCGDDDFLLDCGLTFFAGRRSPLLNISPLMHPFSLTQCRVAFRALPIIVSKENCGSVRVFGQEMYVKDAPHIVASDMAVILAADGKVNQVMDLLSKTLPSITFFDMLWKIHRKFPKELHADAYGAVLDGDVFQKTAHLEPEFFIEKQETVRVRVEKPECRVWDFFKQKKDALSVIFWRAKRSRAVGIAIMCIIIRGMYVREQRCPTIHELVNILEFLKIDPLAWRVVFHKNDSNEWRREFRANPPKNCNLWKYLLRFTSRTPIMRDYLVKTKPAVIPDTVYDNISVENISYFSSCIPLSAKKFLLLLGKKDGALYDIMYKMSPEEMKCMSDLIQEHQAEEEERERALKSQKLEQ